MDINVNYHSSIRIGSVYVDPFGIKDVRKDASIIFITHSHYDHLSFEDIDKVISDKTVFVCTGDVKDQLKKKYYNEIIEVEVNESGKINGVLFTTFASYNINKIFHPRNNNWVGYVIDINGVKYAVLGDSDLTEEVKKIKCDVLFVPIGGTYTMNASEASKLTNIIRPKLVIPVHYNGIVGNKDDEQEFIKGLDNIEYEIYL